MKAVILAAGKGKRLGSFTDKTPKGLVKINEKTILEYIIDDLVQENFNDICIVIGYLGKQIIDYFQTGEKFGVKIHYVYQNEQLGTGDALKQARHFVENDPFLVHLGDAINPGALHENIKHMVDKNNISLLVSPASNARKKFVGNIEMHNNKITRISEKSPTSNSNFYWAGVAYFNNDLIFQTLENMKISHTGEYEITDAINDLILDGIEINGTVCHLSIDAGTEEGLSEIRKNLF